MLHRLNKRNIHINGNIYKKLCGRIKYDYICTMLIHKTYRYAIMPNKEQQVLLSKHFGCVRYVFNHFLNERKEQYEESKKSDNYYAQAKTLTELKKKEDTVWLKEVNSQTLQFALRCLDTAYLNFFRGKAKFPRFKSRRGKNSFTIPQFVTVENSELHIPKFKDGIKINIHRKMKGKISHCTISKTATGKYFVSILCEVEHTPKTKTGKECGIDLGLKDFVITSDGIKFKNNRYTKTYERRLAKAQKHLSHKTKGSQRYENQRLKVAQLHEKIANTRLDNLHKVSSKIISEYDVIALEDLHIKGMIKNRKLSKHIADASWGTFVRLLEYKANWNEKKILKVNRFYPSSKSCSCGWINQNLKLSDRSWTCEKCNTNHDRDVLAANNILKEAKRIIGTELLDNTLRGKNQTSERKHKPMKSEAHLSLANW